MGRWVGGWVCGWVDGYVGGWMGTWVGVGRMGVETKPSPVKLSKSKR